MTRSRLQHRAEAEEREQKIRHNRTAPNKSLGPKQSDAGTPSTRVQGRPDHVAALGAQRSVGNACFVRRLSAERQKSASTTVRPGVSRTPAATTLANIETGVGQLRAINTHYLALAGTPVKKSPPDGMTFIASQSQSKGLGGKPAGYTAIQSAGSFTAPTFTTRMSAEKDGYKRRYFAEVDPTSATDVTHASFYPAPGTHDNAVSEQKDGTYTYYWTISAAISELIRKGEQEHLDDARRAFDLTYGLIAKEINAMAGQKFGPADSPKAAEQLAETALAKRLPAALGTDPTVWFRTLDEMLKMTLKRDHQHLHDVIPGNAVQKGKTFYTPLETTPQTNIDHVRSDDIVNYPSATAPRRPAASAAHVDEESKGPTR